MSVRHAFIDDCILQIHSTHSDCSVQPSSSDNILWYNYANNSGPHGLLEHPV